MSRASRVDEPFLRRDLKGGSLYAVRSAATLFVVLALIAYARWIPRWVDVRLGEATRTASVMNDGVSYAGMAWVAVVTAILAAAVWCAVGILIAWRRSRDLFGIILFIGCAAGGLIGTDLPIVLQMQRTDAWAPFQLIVLFTANAFIAPSLYAFPDGRFVPRFTAVLALAWVFWNLARVATPALDEATLARALVAPGLFVSAGGAAFYRYFRRSDAAQKQQLKWCLLGLLTFLLAYVAVFPIPLLFPQVLEPGPGFIYRTMSSVVYSVSATMLALIVAIAIFRQGLLDIDFILGRTFVYTILTVTIVAGFVFVSSLANNTLEVLTGQRSVLVPVATALPFAVLFVPLRSALVRLADRFMSGSRVLTVLFVDIAGSTELAVRIGDRAWRDLLDRFRSTVRSELRRFGGDEVDTAGDGFFATFAAPERAIQCALVVVAAVRPLGIQARAGVHVGEVEIYGASVTGVAVHVGARLVALAKPGEVLISGSLRNLVAGSNIEVHDRGDYELKGLPGKSRVYAA